MFDVMLGTCCFLQWHSDAVTCCFCLKRLKALISLSCMQEPTKHQYDWDAATTMGFLQNYGLDQEFALNIECNHATLAGHSCDHELQVCGECHSTISK